MFSLIPFLIDNNSYSAPILMHKSVKTKRVAILTTLLYCYFITLNFDLNFSLKIPQAPFHEGF